MNKPINDKRQNYIDWIVMFLLLGNSANPFFYQSVEMLSMSFIVLVVLSYFKTGYKASYNKYLYIYIGTLLLLQCLQSLVYHLFPLKTFFGEYLRIGFAVLALSILGDRFFDKFIQFVYVFAVISLFFYIPCMLIKPLGPFLIKNVASHTLAPFINNFDTFYSNHENIIIFNLGQLDLGRNSGFYWEPGSHGGMLVLALFMNLFYKKEAALSKYNIIFLVTILTTLSTTTYLAVFFVMIVYLRGFFMRRPALSIFIFLALISTSLLLYNKLEFLNKKIEKQIAYSNKGVPGESRFNSFLADMKILSEHPFIGTGRNKEMKFGKNYYNLAAQETHRNNGVGVLMGTYGYPFFFLFLFLLYQSFYAVLKNRINACMGVVLILLIGFSEDYFFKAFFIALVIYCGIRFVPAIRIRRSRKLQLGPGGLNNGVKYY